MMLFLLISNKSISIPQPRMRTRGYFLAKGSKCRFFSCQALKLHHPQTNGSQILLSTHSLFKAVPQSSPRKVRLHCNLPLHRASDVLDAAACCDATLSRFSSGHFLKDSSSCRRGIAMSKVQRVGGIAWRRISWRGHGWVTSNEE